MKRVEFDVPQLEDRGDVARKGRFARPRGAGDQDPCRTVRELIIEAQPDHDSQVDRTLV
jgi:hypothetical protein